MWSLCDCLLPRAPPLTSDPCTSPHQRSKLSFWSWAHHVVPNRVYLSLIFAVLILYMNVGSIGDQFVKVIGPGAGCIKVGRTPDPYVGRSLYVERNVSRRTPSVWVGCTRNKHTVITGFYDRSARQPPPQTLISRLSCVVPNAQTCATGVKWTHDLTSDVDFKPRAYGLYATAVPGLGVY